VRDVEPGGTWRCLIRLTDLLFTDPTPSERCDRRWVARYLGLVSVLALVVFARRPDSILRPQFWAEDGTVFFYEQLTLGFWAALCRPYGGFPFLVQRLVAAFAAFLPTVAIPLAYNASAIAVTASTMATFALPRFRHLVQRDSVRVAFCVATVCIPAGQELLATPTTVGYFLAIWLVFLSVMPAPRTVAATTAWCLGGALAVLSTPAGPLIAPLVGLRLVRGVIRGERRDLAFAVTQTAALAVVIGVVGTLGGDTRLSTGLAAFEAPSDHLRSALGALGWAMASCVDAFFVPTAIFQRLEMRGTLPVVAPAMVAGLSVALAFRELSPRARVTVCLGFYLFASSLYLILVGRHIIVLVIQGAVPSLKVGLMQVLSTRHRSLPNIALLLVAAGIVDGATGAPTRVAAAAMIWAGLLFAWTPEFRVPPFPDLQWPVWAARLDDKLASGSRAPLVIPSHPTFFDIVIDAAPAPDSNPERTRGPVPRP
jgi:hypothetical protein